MDISRDNYDPTLDMIEQRVLEKEARLQEQLNKQAVRWKPPRFERFNMVKHELFDELSAQFKVMVSKFVVTEEPQCGKLVIPNDQPYEILASVADINGHIVIHEWAFDPAPLHGYSASWICHTVRELQKYTSDYANVMHWQGDIITFIRDDDLKSVCKAFYGKMQAQMRKPAG